MKTLINVYQAAIAAISKRATLKDTRHTVAAAEREAGAVITVYASGTDTKTAFVEYCYSRIAVLSGADRVQDVDAARDEADLVNLGIDGVRRVALYPETVVNSELAHAEALTMNEPTPPAAPALRIDQETGDGEFKRGDVHCFKSCGFDCKESVRLALIEHYTKIAEDNGLVAEGWHLRVWHNGGWHGCFVHDASGFMLSDYGVKSGIEEFRPDRFIPAKRWACYNYSTPEGTAQIWVYAATPWQAIGAAIREAQQRITGYRGIVGALAPHQCEHARAADLYGATPEHGYEVKA